MEFFTKLFGGVEAPAPVEVTPPTSKDVIGSAISLLTTVQENLERGIALGKEETASYEAEIQELQTKLRETRDDIRKAQIIHNNINKLL